MVADPRPGDAVDLGFGQEPEIPRGRQRDVVECHAELLSLAGQSALPFRAQNGDRGVQPARDVPGRQHLRQLLVAQPRTVRVGQHDAAARTRLGDQPGDEFPALG
jgi:hypothetical protein